jgi:hypothetical protein
VSTTLTPALSAAARLRTAVGRTLATELVCSGILAAIVIVALFGSHILRGGFQSDDWSLLAAVKFPGAFGYTSSWAALAGQAGSRIGAVVYWFTVFSLFGTHAKFYLATAAVLTLAFAVSFYFVLRVARFSALESAAMMVIAIVLPSADTTRFWATTAGGQICFVFYFLGLAAALHAFDAPQPRRLRWHLLSLGLYAASAAYAEIAMPLVAVSVLIYLTRASPARSFKRWIPDLVIVAACYAGTVVFVSSTAGFGGLSSSQWFLHFELIYGQALTIFSGTAVPFGNGSHALIIALVAVLLGAGVLLWRRGATSAATRRELERWGATFGISVAGAVAGWLTYVPAMLYYEPLQGGNAGHINIVAAAPLAVGSFAVIMLARAVVLELLSAIGPRRTHGVRGPTAAVVLALAAVWFVYVAVDGSLDVRHDGANWTLAQREQYAVLGTVKRVLPNPPQNSTIVTFGEPATTAPDLPVFVSPWELAHAIKVAYGRPDVTGYPVLQFVTSVECQPDGVLVVAGTAPYGPAAAYGRTFFVDTVKGAVTLIKNRANCLAAAAVFPAGPYDLGPESWSI